MPLWSNTDEATSAPKHTVDITTGNTGVEAYQLEPVGTWGVDVTETQVKNVNGHAGWILRTVGSGGRAGRVTEETLVAMGSMSGDVEPGDDAVYPDFVITITEQPEDEEVEANTSASFAVDYAEVPDGFTVNIQWQVSEDDGETWTDIADADSFDLTIAAEDDEYVDGNQFRAVLTSDDAATVTSNVATLTITEPEPDPGP
jgi:hypothetical protein